MVVVGLTTGVMRKILLEEGVFKGAATAEGSVLIMFWRTRASPEYQACLSQRERVLSAGIKPNEVSVDRARRRP